VRVPGGRGQSNHVRETSMKLHRHALTTPISPEMSANVRRSGLDLNLDSCQSAMRSWRCKTEFQFLAAKGSLANMK